MAARIEPTSDQLHAAWLARRKRSWPATLEALRALQSKVRPPGVF